MAGPWVSQDHAAIGVMQAQISALQAIVGTGAFRLVSTADSPVAALDGDLILVDADAGPVTVDLPPIAGVLGAARVSVYKVITAANDVLINGAGPNTVNGQPTLTISTQGDGVALLASDAVDGDWFVIGGP